MSEIHEIADRAVEQAKGDQTKAAVSLVMLVLFVVILCFSLGMAFNFVLNFPHKPKPAQAPLEPLDAVKAALRPFGYTNVMATIVEKDGRWVAITAVGNIPCVSGSLKGIAPEPENWQRPGGLRKKTQPADL